MAKVDPDFRTAFAEPRRKQWGLNKWPSSIPAGGGPVARFPRYYGGAKSERGPPGSATAKRWGRNAWVGRIERGTQPPDPKKRGRMEVVTAMVFSRYASLWAGRTSPRAVRIPGDDFVSGMDRGVGRVGRMCPINRQRFRFEAQYKHKRHIS